MNVRQLGRSENGMDRPCFRPASEHACAGQQQKERYAMPKSNTAVATIGIDPGKNTLHLVGPKQISTGERV